MDVEDAAGTQVPVRQGWEKELRVQPAVPELWW